MKQLSAAMFAYADKSAEHRLPPAALRDPEGRALLSWRVLLLPYLGEEQLFQEFHLDEPWDSPHNLKLLPRMPNVYTSSSEEGAGNLPFTTFYQVVVGPGTPFENGRAVRWPEDFAPKGISTTILIVEVRPATPWTKPDDVVYHPSGPLPRLGGVFKGPGRFRILPSSRQEVTHVVLADGFARQLYPDTPEKAVRWGLLRDSTERMPDGW